jgi:tetratricopeptide (TPR) repeat protein
MISSLFKVGGANPLKTHDISSLISSRMRHAEVVLLVGAGISARQPSCLPLAKSLMNKTVEHFTGEYKRYIDELKMRPEVLFRIIERHEGQALYKFLEREITGTPYNQNHVVLAKALSMGNSVVSTNFDLLIEEACRDFGVSFEPTHDGITYAERLPLLYKIHGSINDEESLMVTINHIHRGLTPQKFLLLQNITKDKLLLVMGYSGLDQLDIMPALKHCSYNYVIWISNSESRSDLVVEEPENPYIKSLRNLMFVSVDTSLLIDTISPLLSLPPPADQTPLRTKNAVQPLPLPSSPARVAADILMHMNEYAQVLTLSSNQVLSDDLYIQTVQLRALNASQPHDPSLPQRRADFYSRLETLPERERDNYYPLLAQYANKDRVPRVAELLHARLEAEGNLSDTILEAGLEIAFRLLHISNYEQCRWFLDSVLKEVRQQADLLLEARCHIIYSALFVTLALDDNNNAELAKQTVDHADRALYLLEKDIFNDEFYLCQAKHNKAMALKILKDYDGALLLYQDALDYFRTRDRFPYAQTLTSIADVHFERGDYETALNIVNEALAEPIETHRSITAGYTHRLRARILKKMLGGDGPSEEVIETYKRAIESYERAGNKHDAEVTRNELANLEESVAGSTPEPHSSS